MKERDFSQLAVSSGVTVTIQGKMRQEPLLVSWLYQGPGLPPLRKRTQIASESLVVSLAPDDKPDYLHGPGPRADSVL